MLEYDSIFTSMATTIPVPDRRVVPSWSSLLILIVGAVLCRGPRAVTNGGQQHDPVAHYTCSGFLPPVAPLFSINGGVGASCVVRTQTFGFGQNSSPQINGYKDRATSVLLPLFANRLAV